MRDNYDDSTTSRTGGTVSGMTGRDYTDSSTSGLGSSGGRTGGITSDRDEYSGGSGIGSGRDTYEQSGSGLGGRSGTSGKLQLMLHWCMRSLC